MQRAELEDEARHRGVVDADRYSLPALRLVVQSRRDRERAAGNGEPTYYRGSRSNGCAGCLLACACGALGLFIVLEAVFGWPF